MQTQGMDGSTPVQRGQADTVPRGGIQQPPPPPAMPQRNRCCERAQVCVLEQAGRLAGAGEVVACMSNSTPASAYHIQAWLTRCSKVTRSEHCKSTAKH